MTTRITLGQADLSVCEGPRLLASCGSSLADHRRHSPTPRALPLAHVVGELEKAGLTGRGGAGFPFHRKLSTAARPRAVVVVNASEGEPASFKDAALALTHPHLVLDGAEWSALAIGAKEIHVILSGECPEAAAALTRAVAERVSSSRLRWRTHLAGAHFVAGQASAVIQLMQGRENAPVTTWQPEAVKGYRGRPTLLSNAETYAHAALVLGSGADEYRRLGTSEEAGTMLLTLRGHTQNPSVLEVAFGTPWAHLLDDSELDNPVLLGGFHGSWVATGALRGRSVTRADAAALGVSLGAGIVLPLGPQLCPVSQTAEVVRFLAGESAGRCGPCGHGLPALAEAAEALAAGRDTRHRLAELCGLLPGRGACAHPDGTVRLVTSLLRAFPAEVAEHAAGRCTRGVRTGAAA